MKLLALIALGILFAVTLSKAEDMTLTDEAIARLHNELDACDAEAKQTGIPMHGDCSDVQAKLIKHYGDYHVYQLVRNAS